MTAPRARHAAKRLADAGQKKATRARKRPAAAAAATAEAKKPATATTKPKPATAKKMKKPAQEPAPEDDGRPRCSWCNGTALYQRYHDEEWGVPVRDDDRKIFEMLSLEGAQAGLSWYTILQKREGYRRHFRNFEIDVVAALTSKDIDLMMDDPGVVRHRGKLESVVSNAKLSQAVQQEHASLSAYLWTFAPADPHSNPDRSQSFTPEAKAMSQALKKRGFKFVGPTICHAFMQAIGMFNDHQPSCFRYELDEAAKETK